MDACIEQHWSISYIPQHSAFGNIIFDTVVDTSAALLRRMY